MIVEYEQDKKMNRAFRVGHAALGSLGGIGCALLVSACALGTHSLEPQQVFDFGPPQVALEGVPSAKTVVVPAVDTSSRLESSGVAYRLGYAQTNEPKVYANSKWAMPPAELLTRRIRSDLALRMNVIASGTALTDSVLRVELDEFSQIFDSSERSRGVVQFRATLLRNGKVLGQRSFVADEAAPTPDAQGGVAALSASTGKAVQALGAWVAQIMP